ncbi:CRISPR-associated helicase Cas3' [Psychrobacter pygoscelis]|uniref:CRISPR-associated helicase Cas3' n=1 Tax=Psychrobacter pygoscelis TaxID=2488563 RepID=UPI00103D108D|nr:CRISPR-associated helicase Cas3' [Psychrobacter pygoscelis]
MPDIKNNSCHQDNKKRFIAHVRQEDGQWLTHDLYEHCIEVGKLASHFADEQGSEYAELQGIFHDVGKYRRPFQKRIRVKSGYGFDEEAHLEQKAGKAPHSTAGAKLIYDTHPLGVLLAYTIAGHHTGLPDWVNEKDSCLYSRLNSSETELEVNETLENLPVFFREKLQGLSDILLASYNQNLNLSNCHIWVRFLFSCLVDADFLDTEAFMSPDKQVLRGNYPSLGELKKSFIKYMSALQASSKSTKVNTLRCDVYQQCINAGKVDDSIFTLTVPTGGGKTLSSMAFALEHAQNFNKKRIIYAIPFTTIIEQNAKVFKKVFDPQNKNACVIEHHSNLDQPLSQETSRSRLATENWDAPIIVTTNIQLFESLFASRTSQCRKIHNIANSVIVLDEAQKIPRDFQKPITDMMRELSQHYGVTWLLCTATQPKLDKHTDAFGNTVFEGLPSPYRIINDEEQLAYQLKRVDIKFVCEYERWTWPQTAQYIVKEDEQCVLAIVNTRNDASALFEQIQTLSPDAIVIHLSASMSPMHRELMITFINEVLKKYHNRQLDVPFYVVSTQLIEAGVDVDFPMVYRAMTGLDSIAQSAGRCNREGKLDGLGKVVVFQPEEDAPNGELLQAQQTTYEILENIKSNPLSPQAFYQYFALFNSKGNPDKLGICDLLTAKRETGTELAISFRTASEQFKLINNSGVTIICPFYHQLMADSNYKKDLPTQIKSLLDNHLSDEWLDTLLAGSQCKDEKLPVDDLLELLKRDDCKRWIYRKLQRYSVTIPKHIFENNLNMFVMRAGLYMAKDYSFFTGIVCDYQPLTRDEVVW